MRVLAFYDIAEPKRLIRVAKIMEDFGARVQKSKFEVDVTERQLRRLMERIAGVIDPEEDGVKYVPLCEGCRQKTEMFGLGRKIMERDYEIL